MVNMQYEPVILIKILGEDDGYWDPTAGSTVAGLLCKVAIDREDIRPDEKKTVTITDGREDRVIAVHNFRSNIPVIGLYYLAFRHGNGYLLDNQATFLEYQ